MLTTEEKKDSLEQLLLALQHAREDISNRLDKKNTKAVLPPVRILILHRIVRDIEVLEGGIEADLNLLD